MDDRSAMVRAAVDNVLHDYLHIEEYERLWVFSGRRRRWLSRTFARRAGDVCEVAAVELDGGDSQVDVGVWKIFYLP